MLSPCLFKEIDRVMVVHLMSFEQILYIDRTVPLCF